MSTSACSASIDDSFGPLVAGCRRNFDFTLAFESLFLAVLPSVIFQASAASQIRTLFRKSCKARWGWLPSLKIGTCLLGLGLQVSLLVLWILDYGGASALTQAAAALSVLDAVVITVLSGLQHTRSVRPSTVLQMYLFMTLLMDAVRVRTLYLQGSNPTLTRLFTAEMIVTLCTLTLESIEKRAFLLETFRSLDPESSTSFLNRCVFWWLNSLIWLGRTKPLQQQDLYTLNAEINSGRLHSTFKNQLLAQGVLKKHRLIRALLSTLKWQFALAILPRLLLIALKFSQPFLLDRLLTLLDSGKSATSSRQAWGIILAFALVYLGIAVVKGRYWHRNFTSITMIRGLLIGGICEKSLQLPNDETSKQSAITLISADTERINLGLRNMHEVWANVIELAVAIYLLQREVGAVAVVPLFIAAACAAGSFLLSRHVVDGQKIWMHDLQKRLNVTTSVFGRLESIKMLGISTWVGDTLSTLRDQEVDSSLIFRTLLLWSVVISEITSMLGPAAMFVAFSLVAYARNDAAVLANTAFTSLAILSLIGPPLATLIQTIPNLLSALACLGRIQDLLEAPSSSRINLENSIDSFSSQQSDQGIRRSTSVYGHETFYLEMSNISSTAMHAPAVVEACAADISWARRSEPVLRNVSFRLLPSQLLVVSGPVGCGKSTLLRAIIGEACVIKGNLTAQSDSVAFCDQTAWLREGSIEDNIITDSEYNHAWYESVIDACELSVDIANFAEGDKFAVGSRGQALSGGQKHRIALARALYSRRRLMIFDDVFSALDKTTAKNVFRKVFGPNGLLRRLGSTVVLVTQSSQHASFSDAVLMLSGDGLVEHCEHPVGSGDDHPKDVPDELEESASTFSKGNIKIQVLEADGPVSRVVNENSPSDATLYMTYVKAVGPKFAGCFMTALMLPAFCLNFSTLWISWWSESNARQPGSRMALYASVYGVLGILSLITFTVACWLALVIMIPRSGRAFHSAILKAALRLPLDSSVKESLGEITNRFSQDIQIIDTQLPFASLNTFEAFTSFLMQMIIIGVTARITAIFIPVCMGCVYFTQRLYLKTSRRLRLLDIEAKAPLLAYHIETLSGLPTIRAFGLEQEVMKHTIGLLEASQQPFYLLLCVQRWLGFVLDSIIACLVILIVVFALKVGSSASAGLTGAALVTVIACNQTLANLVESWTMMETCLGAVQRIKDFSEQKPSQPENNMLDMPFEGWPGQGRVEFNNYSGSYGSTSLPVLKNVSLTIRPGQKVAICGRTGSGKSSLALSLFKLLHTRAGSLTIDGLDIASLDEDAVRSRIASVPQEPLLFKDLTVRQNLRLDGATSDGDAKVALEMVGLWEKAIQQRHLDEPMSGLGLSEGQSQLFCIARALLRQSKLIVFDEATSSLDAESNQQFQLLLKNGLHDRTVVAIEHNPRNVLDYDKVVVLHEGRIVETGSPQELAKVNSAFRRLLQLS
ncbi:P-loop containing nucleoside triphosphate hydrolase protein [Hortaea werneckii]|nr:P-loop containing nucleoside triphosphate hydrolase protein [Hortaea werneckii]KAI7274574.1 P-loop containing nucleoside triphosphate hydrolase protein [Hortaea werneckii]KAI7411620.1 P-loop containing nucleoside triphosphate hydrolase protein [Hortaea werneckii]KAI7448044.1 P-loop containing nucleoside triphosphate hydrolase protein [Hortaea werneckii]KAI7449933.1 P-loop containing nucleoside triphosphate hydrolase protein [Hortaea werneckii]